MVTMPAEDRLAIADLLTDFFSCLDARDTDGLLRLFSEDARVDMGIAGRAVAEGKGAIGAAVGNRPASHATRHLWSSLKISSQPGGAGATFQVMVYVRDDGSAGPARLAHLCDTDTSLARDATDRQWRFTAMTRTVVFVF